MNIPDSDVPSWGEVVELQGAGGRAAALQTTALNIAVAGMAQIARETARDLLLQTVVRRG